MPYDEHNTARNLLTVMYLLNSISGYANEEDFKDVWPEPDDKRKKDGGDDDDAGHP